ncbi:DNA binding domain-containing protein, excisionase family [Bacillus sp. OV166]|uniref:helix-turn-helix domain-containing protein n=1 Tax=Bacillus sp. OV166 TaxID=1882763 RepID=UPI000A2AE8EC|nr:helix-turn-helix domain-containing protein [Bacillus sp. OV166]SMQ60899.1 DNA binding domain-containing protein, excisionase family [Bacillus sp. OV166]
MVEQKLPDILTAQHIADYLGISRRRVYELLQMREEVGGIRNFQIGLSKRVDKKDFFQWIEDQKSNSRREI